MSALSSMVVTIKTLLQSARERVIQSVNTTMVQTYFEIGRIIVEHEQQGSERAEYDAQTLKQVSSGLVEEFGRGFSVTNLQQMRVFYLVYQKQQTVSAKSQQVSGIPKQKQKNKFVSVELQKPSAVSKKFVLSWSHYVFLMRLDAREREFYEREAGENQWSLRELKRQFDSALFERIVLSTKKKEVLEENLRKYHTPASPTDIIVVEITLPKENGQIFASQYKLYLPTKEELRKQIEKV